MDKFKIGILGGETPQGQQLIRLLLGHPIADLVAVSPTPASALLLGREVSEAFPALLGLCSLHFCDDPDVMAQADVVFCADVSADNEELVAGCIKNKCVVLDMGHAFRLQEEDFSRIHGRDFAFPGLHEAAVYGLPELLREEMAGHVLAGMPSAAATAALLALAPLLNEGLVEWEGIFIDLKLPCSERVRPRLYSLDSSSVECLGIAAEIEWLLSLAAGRRISLSLTCCRTPDSRGVLATCSAKAALSANSRTLRSALEGYYSGERFVRLLPAAIPADTSGVECSNFCDISLQPDERTGRVVVCAALDSLMKGSAGQAVQCMNRILSMPEELGLEQPPCR